MDVILQAMLQAFLNVVEFGMTPQQAVEAPRVAAFSFPNSFHPRAVIQDCVAVEVRIGDTVCADLATRSHDVLAWPEREFDAGGVSMCLDLWPPRAGGRALGAAADPRLSTYAIGR